MTRRKIEESFFRILMVLATIIVAGSFFLIVGTIFYKGVPFMSIDMVTKIPGGGFYIGKEGGVLNAIVGSMYIAGGATLLGLLISIPVAIFINMYLGGRNFIANALRIAFDVLFGIPSIVYGAFGFLIMVYFGIKASLLGGIVAVTLLVIPILVRTLDEVIRTVPHELRDASLSLGATRWEMSKVILRQIRPGIFTAILLSFGRAIGDVASVLFTAGFSDNIPTSLHQPAATLPLAIFFQLGSPVDEVRGRAYASALILTIIVLIITILSSILAKRFQKTRFNMTNNPHISVQHLSVQIGNQQILKDISINIPNKKVISIIGPSGCSKTTLLKSFNRLLDDTADVKVTGKVLVDGENIYDPDVEVTHIRKKMGLLSQRPYPLPMSIYDNIAYGPRLHGHPKKAELDELVETQLKATGLWHEVKDRLNASASRLSIGQQQRLCLARGLAVEPEIILGDESTSALDPISTSIIEDLFIKLKEKYTIVLVTHILRQARRVSDYIIFVYMGKIIEFGPTEELLLNPQQELTKEYVKGFIS